MCPRLLVGLFMANTTRLTVLNVLLSVQTEVKLTSTVCVCVRVLNIDAAMPLQPPAIEVRVVQDSPRTAC